MLKFQTRVNLSLLRIVYPLLCCGHIAFKYGVKRFMQLPFGVLLEYFYGGMSLTITLCVISGCASESHYDKG